MGLTTEQNKALNLIVEWLGNDNEWEFRLGGYAGTGKTYLLQHLINSYTKRVTCCAPTGKAASVLMAKLNGREVTTIHRAIYMPVAPSREELDALLEKQKDDPDNLELKELIKKEEEKIKKNNVSFCFRDHHEIERGQLVIIDEASMVTEKMRTDIKNIGCKALFVGDPGQLPPVGGGGWFVRGEFGAVLETVQRQALDSSIIRMSMAIRDGSLRRSHYPSGDCCIVSSRAIDDSTLLEADQVITGRNATRHRLNRFFRSSKGFEGSTPVTGEKLICLKNENADGMLFINGVQCTSTSATDYDEDTDTFYIGLNYEGDNLPAVPFYDYHCRLHYEKDLTESSWLYRKDLRELDYAYAITCHKAQGSEWDNVVISDDKMNRKDRTFRQRWLYTAVTRAKRRLTWVQD